MLKFKLFKLWRKKKAKKEQQQGADFAAIEYWQSAVPALPPISQQQPPPVIANVFTLKEMLQATSNFSHDNLLGEGGFGKVYRGVLKNGQIVAIKQMDPTLSKGVQGEREFRVEVDILSRLSNSHLVKLVGYCADKNQRMLVYEFMNQGSLHENLHSAVRLRIDWKTRIQIASGAAKALSYLHNGPAGNPVIHRDFKSSNILLDRNLQPKVSDFGLAKLMPFGTKKHVSTRVLGTFGYFDPQYAATGRLTLKSDVYAFGVVMLELVTGRRPVNADHGKKKQSLVSEVRDSLRDKKKLKRILDPEITQEPCFCFCWETVRRFASLAYDCIRDDDERRPTMSQCARELEHLHVMAKLAQL